MINNVQNLNGPGNLDSGINPALGGAGFTGGGSGIKFEPIYGSLESPGGAPLIDIGVIDERRGLSPDGPPPIDIGVINDQLFQDQTNR